MKKMKKMMKNMVCMLLCAVMALSVITIWMLTGKRTYSKTQSERLFGKNCLEIF